ncbi:MAG: hypothetical protein J4F31_05320 [Flavobacteriales bacterium]|nr:hypothetical protein [Flavobacteriales bacterium]
MIKRFVLLLFLVPTARFATVAQNTSVSGEVSYVASENVYVRFSNTSDLTQGDTLFFGGEPCLRVMQISSVSAVTERIGDCDPAKGDEVILIKKRPPEAEPAVAALVATSSTEVDTAATTEEPEVEPEVKKARPDHVDGRISFASYSNYTPDDNVGGYTRLVGRAYVNADRIAGSRFSFNTYLNYQEYIRSDNNPSSGPTTLVNIYRAAITCHARDSLRITPGRAINHKASSLGPIDGLQAEKYWGAFYAGAIVGSRPDLDDFGYDPSLFEYGVYSGFDKRKGDWWTQATLGFLEQRNNRNVDRRHLYLQQSTSVGKWYAFASGEVDLYENFDTASAASTFKLTSIYASLRYRFNRHWTAFASFDSRDRIIFFEQFDTEIERLLAEQNIRQGYRVRLNYRSSGGWSIGAVYNYRKELNTENYSQFVQIYGMYRLPWIGGNLSARYGRTTSRYLSTRLWSARYSRNFFDGKAYSAIYYRGLSYENTSVDIQVPGQHYYGVEANTRLASAWRLGALGEYSKQGNKRAFLRRSLRTKQNFTRS